MRFEAGVVVGLLMSGCAMSIQKGALKLFSDANVCPPARVTVKPRPDVPPHTLLGEPQALAAPPEVASDPERLKMWHALQETQTAAVDESGQTLELAGCGKTDLYVCSHPTEADFGNGAEMITGDLGITAGNGTMSDLVLSAVMCRTKPAQFDADAVALPEQVTIDALPTPLRELKVRPRLLQLGPDRRPAAQPLPDTVVSQCNVGAHDLCAKLGWSTVDDDSADLEVIVPCHGRLDERGAPVSALKVVQSPSSVELVLPPTDVAALSVKAQGATLETIPVGPRHLRCDLPQSPGRVEQCAARLVAFDTARIERAVAQSQALQAFARSHRSP